MTSAARTIVTHLRGKWFGSYGTVCCPAHEDRSPSLRIRDGENGSPLVSCYAGCDRLDIIRELKSQGAWPERLEENGTSRPTFRRPVRHYATAEPKRITHDLTAEDVERINFGAAIWRMTIPAPGTPAERYWTDVRGLARLDIPKVIRYAAAVPYGYDRPGEAPRRRLPAMVAKIQAADGAFRGIHCTYLLPDGSDKARDLPNDRLVFGSVGGCAIHLAEPDASMCCGEGIETTAAYMQDTGLAGWAAMNTSGLRMISLPPLPAGAFVAVLQDNDKPKRRPDGSIFYPGAEASRAATARLRLEGRHAEIMEPAEGWKDFAEPYQRENRE